MWAPGCRHETKGGNAAQDPWALQTSGEWLYLIMDKQPYSDSSLPAFFSAALHHIALRCSTQFRERWMEQVHAVEFDLNPKSSISSP